MEVDTDDDLLASNEFNSSVSRSKGPPPDVTHHSPRFQKSSHSKQSSTNHSSNFNSTNSNKSNQHNNNEYQPLLDAGENSMSEDQYDGSDFVQLSINNFEDDPEFNDIVKQVEFAIDHNIMPQRIYEGSSGSYFAKNSDFVNFF